MDLTDLPEVIAKELNTFNQRIIGRYTDHLLAYIQHQKLNKYSYESMPLSGVQFRCLWTPITNTKAATTVSDTDMLLSRLEKGRLPFFLRSVFVAMSRNKANDLDKFGCVDELKSSCRSGISVMSECVPTMKVNDIILNNFVVDFYCHGQRTTLILENRISDSHLFHKLHSFELLLRSIVAILDKESLEAKYFSGLVKRFNDQIDETFMKK